MSASAFQATELRNAQVRQLVSQAGFGLVGALVSTVVIAFALRHHVGHVRLLVWLGLYGAVQAPRYALLRAFPGYARREGGIFSWGHWFSVLTALSGLVWGMSAILIYPVDSMPHQLLLAIAVAGISAAAAVVYSPLKQCYMPTIIMILAPLSGRLFYEADEANLIMGSVILIFGAVLVKTGGKIHETNSQSLTLGFENQKLVHDLRAEIEERKRAEQALTKSEERLELALHGADLCLWDWSIARQELFLDPNWMRTLGYSSQDIDLRSKWWQHLIHPDDLAEVSAALAVHLNGSKSFYEAEHRVCSRSGDWKWVLARGKIVECDSRGNPLRMTGTLLDITDRKSAEEQIRASLAEKEVLLREIHHRVKNNLQVMSSLLRLQSRYVRDEQYREMFTESVNRVQSLALVHEKLYQSQNLSEIQMNEFLSGLSRQILGTYEHVTGKISVKVDVPHVSLGIELAMPLGFIVTELLSNSLKHAFPADTKGAVNISLCPSNGDLELTVSDNGIGMPEEVALERHQTLGLRLVAIFVEQLHGQTEIRSKPGTQVHIIFNQDRHPERPFDTNSLSST